MNDCFKNAIKYSLVGGVIASSWMALVSSHLFIGLNDSSSLPGRVFVLSRSKYLLSNLKKEDLILFKAPATSFYPGKKIVKIIKGVAGENVAINHNRIFIENTDLGALKKYSSYGQQLVPLAERKIAPNYYFGWAPHEDSYDSRYQSLGLIHQDQIMGRVLFWF